MNRIFYQVETCPINPNHNKWLLLSSCTQAEIIGDVSAGHAYGWEVEKSNQETCFVTVHKEFLV